MSGWLVGIAFTAVLGWLTFKVGSPVMVYLIGGGLFIVGVFHMLGNGPSEYGIFFIAIGAALVAIGMAHDKFRLG